MEVVLVFLFFGWIYSVAATSPTRAWWVPRVIPAILGILSLTQISDAHGEAGVIQALANGVFTIAGLILLGLSVVTLGYRLVRGSRGALMRGSPSPPPVPPAIPPAYVVTRGDRPRRRLPPRFRQRTWSHAAIDQPTSSQRLGDRAVDCWRPSGT